MGKIDSDYLWLHERPPSSSRLRRLALLLLIPLIAGAAWLTTTPQAPAPDGDQAHASEHEPAGPATVNARVGTHRSAPAPSPSIPHPAGAAPGEGKSLGQHTVATALGAPQTGAAEIAVAALDSARVLDADDSLTEIPLAASESEPVVVDTSRSAQGSRTAAQSEWRQIHIESGDTLSIAFNRNGLSYADSLEIAHMPEYGRRFTRGLKAGDTMRVRADANGRVLALNFPLDALRTLQVRPGEDGFSGAILLTDVEHRTAYATGVIDTSFYVDALEAGLSNRQIMKLVTIFGWDIDFALDIRTGARFVVVFEELYRDGDKVADGPILAASFVNRGNNVRALRYTNASNESQYYSPDGRAMKKAFIRTPVEYTRISSGFNLSRKHPILNRIRRHEGTDYAAPSGTPIKATGNGRVVFRGRRGGYGNTVIIKHDSRMSTRYGHMSGFANGIGVGSKVRQGDVIGYVGMTGLATGPHLHYEFRVDGEPKNPETVALPKSTPLPQQLIADFKRRTAPLLAQLDTLTDTDLARAQGGDDSRSN